MSFHVFCRNARHRLGMSSVGFTAQSKDEEIEKLREAWKTLNDLIKNFANAEACLKNLDLKLTVDHLKEKAP